MFPELAELLDALIAATEALVRNAERESMTARVDAEQALKRAKDARARIVT